MDRLKAEVTRFHNASSKTSKGISPLTQQGPFRDFSWGQNSHGYTSILGLEDAGLL